MNEPNRCLKCQKPIAPNQTYCHEHFVDNYLDEEMDGESWGDAPIYHEDWDDSDYDELEDYDD